MIDQNFKEIIDPDAGIALDDLSDVTITSPTDDDLLFWDEATGLWIDKQINDLDKVSAFSTPGTDYLIIWEASTSKHKRIAFDEALRLDNWGSFKASTLALGQVYAADSATAGTWQRLPVLEFFNGTFLEPFDAKITSDGATITMTLEQSGGGDLTMLFSDAYTTLDCTPAASIALTAGTDTIPQANYVYIPQSTKVLTKSTTAWPSAEHIKVAYFYVQSASLVNTGASGNNWGLINQNWNDEKMDTNSQGHMSHIAELARRGGPGWRSGCEGVATQDGNDLWVSIATGVMSQLHNHTFAALDSDTAGAGDPVVVVNDPDAAFTTINSLNSITKNSDGDLISNNKFVKFVLWAVINKSGEPSPMMINLPSEFYNTQAEAETDVDGHANFTIPAEFSIESSTGFLIASFVCQHTATAMNIMSTQDLRGQTPSNVAGGGTGGGDVTAATAITDHAVVRGDGGAKGVQDSGIIIDDSDNITGVTTIDIDVATGTAPLTVASTTVVTNLNADQLDGRDAGEFLTEDGTTQLSGNWDVGGFRVTAETLESDVVTGTAPLVVASTTLVTNLNADLLDGNEASAFATASANMTDHTIVRGDGGSKGVQDTGITIDDSNILLMPTTAEIQWRDTEVNIGSPLDGYGRFEADTILILGNHNIFLGDGQVGTDVKLTFDGETSNGILKWMEDEDYFQFEDAVVMDLTLDVAGVITSTYAAGAPLVIADSTKVSNLNADLLDGHHVTGMLVLDQINDTPSALTASTDPVMALVLSTTTGTSAVMYEAWGYMAGTGNAENSWEIYAEDPANAVLTSVLVHQAQTGTGDYWEIPFYICGYHTSPSTGATGYHLDCDEITNGATLNVQQTRLTRILS